MTNLLLVVLLGSTFAALQRAWHYRRLAQGPVLRRPVITLDDAGRGLALQGDVQIIPLVPVGQVDLLRQVQPGDEILVWAHDRQSPLEPEYDGELWKHGIVAELKHGIAPATWRNTTIVFQGGRRVFAMPQAKTFLVARHGAPTAAEPVLDGATS